MRSIVQRLGIATAAAALLSGAAGRSTAFCGAVKHRRGGARTAVLVLSELMMSTTSNTEPETDSTKQIRVLALHGSGGDANEFPSRLEAIGSALKDRHGLELDITAVNAPHSHRGGGYAWWIMPEGVRSFNAEKYGGFDESASLVLEYWNNGKPYDFFATAWSWSTDSS